MKVLFHPALRALGRNNVADLPLGDVELYRYIQNLFARLARVAHVPMGDRLYVNLPLCYKPLYLRPGFVYYHASVS